MNPISRLHSSGINISFLLNDIPDDGGSFDSFDYVQSNITDYKAYTDLLFSFTILELKQLTLGFDSDTLIDAVVGLAVRDVDYIITNKEIIKILYPYATTNY